jgi:hypothetical protein
MPRKSRAIAANDRNVVARLLQNLPPNVATGSEVEKALWLYAQVHNPAAVCDTLQMPISTFRRALDARNRGRPVGAGGRPTYLTAPSETRLKEWIKVENQAGRGPPLAAIQEKVRLQL